ncbi:huntingtin-interacting protein K isoform X1 [Phyllopteryx taeniolatus]|uniref:huntingtin-interacting protein K isoform X1 n=1 Tax=Phyllopteryx taeniolatus TaxID=161469 RepID=UPI002AD4CAF1|nr:huntingtin-interacting protein K isoform X1 [Phyllopteryx taeniolatus]
MATEGDVDLDLEADENCTGKPAEKPRKHDSGAADLERVTDYAEEKEISSSDLQTAMSVIGDRRSREQKAKQEREKELAKVTIKKEDVELICVRDVHVVTQMSEMEISRFTAERSLREHMGNVVEALVALTS